MALIIVAYIFFGCFLEAIGMVLITVPVFLPMVKQFGYDPVWFGIIVVIVAEVGLIHPPVGLNLFVIQAHAPDIKITSIYRGIVPFLLAPLILIILMFLFPGIALWLPKAAVRLTNIGRRYQPSAATVRRTPSPRMKRSRICTGSRSVAPTPGLPSMRAAIKVGPPPCSAAATCVSKSSSSAAQWLLARPDARAIATRSAVEALAVGCEPVIW